MSDRLLMLRNLFLEDQETYKSVILTPFQMNLLIFFLNNDDVKTSYQLAVARGILQTTACFQLKSLCDKGYLQRVQIEDKYNRIEYEYFIKDKVSV